MDQQLHKASILAMLVFLTIGMLRGVVYGEWTIEPFIGFGTALALYFMTFVPSSSAEQRKTN